MTFQILGSYADRAKIVPRGFDSIEYSGCVSFSECMIKVHGLVGNTSGGVCGDGSVLGTVLSKDHADSVGSVVYRTRYVSHS